MLRDFHLVPLKLFISGGSSLRPGKCSAISGQKTKADNWNGKEWDVALKADDYGISNIDECMKRACLPYKDCIGVGWHPTPPLGKCFVWENCDFDNLQDDLPYYTLKRGNSFSLYLRKVQLKNTTIKVY